MDTQQILTSDAKVVIVTVSTHTSAPVSMGSNESISKAADSCKNGVCSLTWKPQRPAA